MVNLGAIELNATINGSNLSENQIAAYYSKTTSGDNGSFVTLTLNSLSNPQDEISFYINVIADVPDTFNGTTNLGKIGSYCVIGSGGLTGVSPGAVNFATPGNGMPLLDMSKGNLYTVSMKSAVGSRLYNPPTYSIFVNSPVGGGGSNPTNGVQYYDPTTYTGFNSTTKNTESFNFGTGTSISYGAKPPAGLTTYGSLNVFSQAIIGAVIIQYYWPPQITSDICFPAGTPVKTDQGLLPIEKLQPGINTINRNRIEHITRTITNDNYLVCFEKDSLDINLPIRRTLISKNHKILYKNKLIEAYKFINSFHGVHKVEYKGETLYNVLMEDYYTMNVNNLICETLHPKNVVARLHNSSYSAEDKNKIICMLSETLKNKDSTTYKKMAMTLTSKK